jgi:hypothetical protein
MKRKVVEEFGVYSFEVNYCKKIGIKDTAESNDLFKNDYSYKQVVGG